MGKIVDRRLQTVRKLEKIVSPQGYLALQIKILVIGCNHWGKGDTLEEAIKIARKHAGGKLPNWIAYLVPAEVYVDEMGYITYPRDMATPFTSIRIAASPSQLRGERQRKRDVNKTVFAR
jgi:hypothetical protein